MAFDSIDSKSDVIEVIAIGGQNRINQSSILDENMATGAFGEPFNISKEIRVDEKEKEETVHRPRMMGENKPGRVFGFLSSETEEDYEFDTGAIKANRSSSSKQKFNSSYISSDQMSMVDEFSSYHALP